MKCAPKKSKIPPNFFVPSVSVVGIRADGHVSGMRGPSVMSSVLTVRNSIGMRADGHVACMRGPSVMSSVYVQTDTCQACVRQPVGDSVGSGVGKTVGNPSMSMAKSRIFFATLCEIPTGYIPSVLESEKPSVSRQKSVGECGKIRIFFATLCEIPTGYIPSLYPSVKR